MRKKLIAALLCGAIALSSGICTAAQPDMRMLFLQNYATPDADALDLARIPRYDTVQLARMKNVYYFPAYHNSAPTREQDFRYKPVAAQREQIFKVYTVKNPNYVTAFLARGRLGDLLSDTPQYAVPVTLGDSTGVLFYQRDAQGAWQPAGCSRFWVPFDGGTLFDPDAALAVLQARGMTAVEDMRFVRFAERHLFLYARNEDDRECLLSLTNDGFLGAFGDGFGRDFGALFPAVGTSVNPTAPDLPAGGLQAEKPDFSAQAAELQDMGLAGWKADADLLGAPTWIEAVITAIRVSGQAEQAGAFADPAFGKGYLGYARKNGLLPADAALTAPISQRAYLQMLLRAMGYALPDRPLAAFQRAVELGLVDSAVVFPPYEQSDVSTDMDIAGEVKALFTRGDMAKLTHAALECLTADGAYLWQKIWW